MAALLGFEKLTTSEAITVSRWEIIIIEQINKFFDAATSLPSVSPRRLHQDVIPPARRGFGSLL
jgi:hypothetical protein